MSSIRDHAPSGLQKLPVLVIAGPTASGKTELAIEVALQCDGEVIGADSRQIYRYLDIGTAKPTAAQCKGITYHMISILPPDAVYSAAEFGKTARQLIRDIHERGKLPILAGGTGLYIRAALWGLFDSPARSPVLRQNLRQIAAQEGLAALHDHLRLVDPISANRISANDYQRIERALEFFMLTGTSISESQQQHGFRDSPFIVKFALVSRSRDRLWDAIYKRVILMFNQGFIQEVERLLARGYPRDLPAMTSLGYRTVINLLEGKCTRDAAIDEVAVQTRQYAKRQLTWFKREPIDITLINDQPADFSRAVALLCNLVPRT